MATVLASYLCLQLCSPATAFFSDLVGSLILDKAMAAVRHADPQNDSELKETVCYNYFHLLSSATAFFNDFMGFLTLIMAMAVTSHAETRRGTEIQIAGKSACDGCSQF